VNCRLCSVYNNIIVASDIRIGSVIRRYLYSRERQPYKCNRSGTLYIFLLRLTRFDRGELARARSDRITGVDLHYFHIFIKTVRNLSRYINETGAYISNNKFNKQNDALFIRGEGKKRTHNIVLYTIPARRDPVRQKPNSLLRGWRGDCI